MTTGKEVSNVYRSVGEHMHVAPLSRYDLTVFLNAAVDTNFISREYADRVMATFDQLRSGRQEPTNEELNEWAADAVMGWFRELGQECRLDKDGKTVRVMYCDEWNPSENFFQALQVAQEAGREVRCLLGTNGLHTVLLEHPDGIASTPVYEGYLDEARAARELTLNIYWEFEP